MENDVDKDNRSTDEPGKMTIKRKWRKRPIKGRMGSSKVGNERQKCLTIKWRSWRNGRYLCIYFDKLELWYEWRREWKHWLAQVKLWWWKRLHNQSINVESRQGSQWCGRICHKIKWNQRGLRRKESGYETQWLLVYLTDIGNTLWRNVSTSVSGSFRKLHYFGHHQTWTLS